ncbi:MAG: hypothetical protein HY534_08250 [Chloroflexi bacterium]|nr:hypothetical protein [Chloroflexota bacterium]
MSRNVMSPTLKDRYLEQLKVDETAIAEAAAAFETAKAALEMGLRRYTALRDFVAEQLGVSPYAPGIDWPGDSEFYDEPGRGLFRFTGMKIGDAAMQVLVEEYEAKDGNNPWLSLNTIMRRLEKGGLGFPEPVQARAINAALLALTKAGSVKKGAYSNRVGAVYAYNPASDDTEDASNEGGE